MKNNISVRLFSAATAFALLASAAGIGWTVPIASAVGPVVTTTPATSITSTDAALNGLNGTADADGSSFWVSTSTFTPVGGATPTMPAGVFSTPDLGAIASSTAFSAPLTSTVGLPAVTPDTTYYFTAWTEVGGVWSPGTVLNFTTVSAPTIATTSPSAGSTLGGTAVTITGTGFVSGATVTIGGTPATSVVVASSTSITAVTPVGTAGAKNVVVTNLDTGSTTSAGGFTYVTPAVSAPTVSSVSPTSGTTAGGTTVIVVGTNLTGATAVHFGTALATGVTVSSSTSLTATSPAGTGAVDVTVTTAGGTSATSSADQFTYTAVAPATPVISNITVSPLASTTATVNWTTDIAANGQVMYGTTTSYGSSSALSATATTTHSILLSGLSEGTVYHFKISSSNGSSTATSSDQTFVTQSTASSTPLAVTSVTTVNASATADNSFADGWKWTMHLTLPDNENAFRIRFSDWAMNSTTSFPAAANIRLSSPQSSNASTPSAGVIETGNDYSGWLYLNGDSAPLTPGRQIDLTIEVKIPVGTPSGAYTTTYTAQSWPQTATSTAI